MVIVMESSCPDKPVNEFLKGLLALSDDSIKEHISFDCSELCIYFSGRFMKFSEVNNVVTRANAAMTYCEHFSDAELNSPKNFSFCTVTYKGVVVSENYLLSDWFMDYMEIKGRFKNYSREHDNVLLWVSHLYQKDKDGSILPPHFHVLYNMVPRENKAFYSFSSEIR